MPFLSMEDSRDWNRKIQNAQSRQMYGDHYVVGSQATHHSLIRDNFVVAAGAANHGSAGLSAVCFRPGSSCCLSSALTGRQNCVRGWRQHLDHSARWYCKETANLLRKRHLPVLVT